MQITFLGTSCMVPTKERNHQAIVVRVNGRGYLFDCGEGTQRQLKLADIKPTCIAKIFISHWHGDHVFGLPGLLQTLASMEYQNTLAMYGPKGIKKAMKQLLTLYSISLPFKLDITEVAANTIKDNEVTIQTQPLEHSAPTIGFSLQTHDKINIKTSMLKKHRIPNGPHLALLSQGKNSTYQGKILMADAFTTLTPGKKITILMDSLPCDAMVTLAKNADLVISESTYDDQMQDKAKDYKHMTASQAAIIAKNAGAKKLILTHFSPRYKSPTPLVNQARKIFAKTSAANDLMHLRL